MVYNRGKFTNELIEIFLGILFVNKVVLSKIYFLSVNYISFD